VNFWGKFKPLGGIAKLKNVILIRTKLGKIHSGVLNQLNLEPLGGIEPPTYSLPRNRYLEQGMPRQIGPYTPMYL